MPDPRPPLSAVPGPAERRGAERFAAAMPVRVDGEEGVTRNLSTGGLSFLSGRAWAPGARVEVVIEYLLDGHDYPLRCEAEVLRSEPEGGSYRIGARLVPDGRVHGSAAGGGDAHPDRRPRLRSA